MFYENLFSNILYFLLLILIYYKLSKQKFIIIYYFISCNLNKFISLYLWKYNTYNLYDCFSLAPYLKLIIFFCSRIQLLIINW